MALRRINQHGFFAAPSALGKRGVFGREKVNNLAVAIKMRSHRARVEALDGYHGGHVRPDRIPKLAYEFLFVGHSTQQ